MNNRRRRLLLPALLLLGALSLTPAGAQTSAHAVAAAPDPLQLLPASDVVLLIEHRRLWTEALPRILASDPAHLAKINEEMEKFKAKSGVDIHSINRIAVGVRFLNPEAIAKGPDKKDIGVVIIGQGDFEASRFIDALRREEKDKVHETTYNGQTIYTLDEREKGDTKPRPEIETPAFAVLDANTLAIGDLMQIHATIDVKNGSGSSLSPDLLTLATRNSNALVSLAGNVPPTLTASLAPKGSSGNGDLDTTVSKFFELVAAIKQTYISLGLTPDGIEAVLGARLSGTEQAQSLGDMLLGARQQYSVFIEDKMIRDLVTNMQIKAEGDEVQLRAELPQTTLAMMLRAAATPAAKPATAMAAKPKEPTPAQQQKKKKRRSTRRKGH